MTLSSEQKQVIKTLYKKGAKIVISESHIDFLSKSIENKFIPKSFKVNSNLPGVKTINQERLDLVSFECVKDEKRRHENILKAAKLDFEKFKVKLGKLFDDAGNERELKRIEEHLQKVKSNLEAKKAKKVARDTIGRSNFSNVTLADDDGASVQAHREITGDNVSSIVTIAAGDGARLQAHRDSSGFRDSSNVTLALDDGASLHAHKKKKRKFRRRYLQPQPKKSRKRKSRQLELIQTLNAIAPNWNGIIKNISGDAVTFDEESLLSKGQKFCPVELDPPIVRMQKELDRFYRMIRINWAFQGKPDQRSELEKKFYENSNWNPPPASKELEQFIAFLQQKFDSWKPPRFIKDNISKGERNCLKEIRNNTETVYMVEDKGPSFTKMSKDQYLEAGENELSNEKFYEQVTEVCP